MASAGVVIPKSANTLQPLPAIWQGTQNQIYCFSTIYIENDQQGAFKSGWNEIVAVSGRNEELIIAWDVMRLHYDL